MKFPCTVVQICYELKSGSDAKNCVLVTVAVGDKDTGPRLSLWVDEATAAPYKLGGTYTVTIT